jgi:lipoprotein-releasing system ATP-binding protein
MVAIMGASGAGKSTLLHLLGGLDVADGGSVKLNDLEITRAGGALLARFHRREVGFIFQFHHLLPDLTAAENVALPLLINREKRSEAMRRASVALDELGLGEFARQPVSHLSGGEQQRVAVARALDTEPRLVLADEPTGNLDAAIGEEIGALLASYCRTRGAAVVIATHNMHLAQACDRILHLKEGRIEQQVD